MRYTFSLWIVWCFVVFFFLLLLLCSFDPQCIALFVCVTPFVCIGLLMCYAFGFRYIVCVVFFFILTATLRLLLLLSPLRLFRLSPSLHQRWLITGSTLLSRRTFSTQPELRRSRCRLPTIRCSECLTFAPCPCRRRGRYRRCP